MSFPVLLEHLQRESSRHCFLIDLGDSVLGIPSLAPPRGSAPATRRTNSSEVKFSRALCHLCRASSTSRNQCWFRYSSRNFPWKLHVSVLHRPSRLDELQLHVPHMSALIHRPARELRRSSFRIRSVSPRTSRSSSSVRITRRTGSDRSPRFADSPGCKNR